MIIVRELLNTQVFDNSHTKNTCAYKNLDTQACKIIIFDFYVPKDCNLCIPS